MLNRLINIPLNKESFNKELYIIKNIARNNGYKGNMIDKLLYKKQRQNTKSIIFPVQREDNNKKWRKIPYNGSISEKLGRNIRQFNVNAAYFNNYTLGKLLVNNKVNSKQDALCKSGVYEISCSDCQAIYIGKSKRDIKSRFLEHANYARHNKHASGLASHLIENNHHIETRNVKLIHSIRGGPILDRFEIVEIKRALAENKLLTNDQLDFGNNPLLNPELV